MESWVLTLVTIAGSAIAMFAVNKYQVGDLRLKDADKEDRLKALEKEASENRPLLTHLSKVEEGHGKKLDLHSNQITELRQWTAQAPTMEQVRREFVTKEMFFEMKEHVNEKINKVESLCRAEFNKVEQGIDRVLDRLAKDKK